MAGGKVEGGAGARIVGKFGDEVLERGLGVGVAAGFKLRLAEGELRGGRFRAERDRLVKRRDRRIILLQAQVGLAQADIVARVARVGASPLLKESDGAIELLRGEVGAAEPVLIRDVGGGGSVRLLESGNGFRVVPSRQIKRRQQVVRGSKLRITSEEFAQLRDGFVVLALRDEMANGGKLDRKSVV